MTARERIAEYTFDLQQLVLSLSRGYWQQGMGTLVSDVWEQQDNSTMA
jgi:hypothetical protein